MLVLDKLSSLLSLFSPVFPLRTEPLPFASFLLPLFSLLLLPFFLGPSFVSAATTTATNHWLHRFLLFICLRTTSAPPVTLEKSDARQTKHTHTQMRNKDRERVKERSQSLCRFLSVVSLMPFVFFFFFSSLFLSISLSLFRLFPFPSSPLPPHHTPPSYTSAGSFSSSSFCFRLSSSPSIALAV